MICYLLSRGKLEDSQTSQRKPQLNRNNLSSNELSVFQFKVKQSKASKPRCYGQIVCDNSTLQQERSRQKFFNTLILSVFNSFCYCDLR